MVDRESIERIGKTHVIKIEAAQPTGAVRRENQNRAIGDHDRTKLVGARVGARDRARLGPVIVEPARAIQIVAAFAAGTLRGKYDRGQSRWLRSASPRVER